MSGPGDRGLRDAARHLGAVLPHGGSLPEAEWQSRQRALRWLLWAHVVAIPIITLLFDQGLDQAALDLFTPTFFAIIAQLRRGSRRVQSLIVTVGLLSCSALIVHITGGLTQAYFHFFVMVAALSLYEDWLPFATAVVYVLIQQAVTAEVVDYDEANSPWRWGLVHAAFIGALSLVCLATWRASARDREAFRSLVQSLEEGVVMIDRNGQMITANPSATRILGMDPAEVLAGYGHAEWSFIDADGQPLPTRETPAVHHRDDRRAAGVRGGRAAAAARRDALARGLHARRGDRPRPAVHDRRLVHRRHRGARGRRGARALQHRALPVRLHRLARPVRAAADGVELPRAAAPPLPRAGWTGTRTSSSSTPSTAPRACGR